MRRHTIVLGAPLLVVAIATPAQAYVDPGAGSLIAQLLFGGIAGLAVVLKLTWRRMLTRIGWLRDDPPVDRDGTAD